MSKFFLYEMKKKYPTEKFYPTLKKNYPTFEKIWSLSI